MKPILTRSILAITLAASVALPIGDADAALNAYLKAKGQTQGPLKSGVMKKGAEGGVKVLSVNHEIVSPRDAASGLATGKRQHKPFRVRLPVDATYAFFFRALTTNEKISEWELSVLTEKGTPAYKVRLFDVNVSRISYRSTDDRGAAEEVDIEFTYRKIEWTWADGGVTAEDDWESPVAHGAPTKPKKPG